MLYVSSQGKVRCD